MVISRTPPRRSLGDQEKWPVESSCRFLFRSNILHQTDIYNVPQIPTSMRVTFESIKIGHLENRLGLASNPII
jgi:hypothetical protein